MRLFQPIKLGSLELRNRVVMPAMHLSYTPDGQINDSLINFYVERAIGGAGLIIVGGCAIDEVGGGPGMVRLDHPRFLDGLQDLTRAVKAHGARIGAQLYQAGRYAHSAFTGMQPVAPSPLASRLTGQKPQELSVPEIKEIVDRFVQAALLAKEAGFDAVEILGSAGYLISQFLSPVTNQREDEYGGSWENRLRFPLEVVCAVIAAVGSDYPVLVRVAGNDFIPGSNTGAEAAAFCQELDKAGVAAINVTGGWHETRVPQLTMNVPAGAFVYLANNIKQKVSVPVIACNRINDPAMAEVILATGQADLIGVARGFLAEPKWASKAQDNKAASIRPCIGCNQGCLDHVFSGLPVGCLTNPRAGREGQTPVLPTAEPKQVLVVGGGPGGMVAARILAIRGHRVTLWEQQSVLGGQLRLAAIPPGRHDFARFIDYLVEELQSLAVDIHLGKKADLDTIKQGNFDEVIVATGAVESKPQFLYGGVEENLVSAWDILEGKTIAGRQVVVVGGGPTGIETALYLALEGGVNSEQMQFLHWHQGETPEKLAELLYQSTREVTLIEQDGKIGKGVGLSTRWSMLADLKRLGINTLVSQKVVEIEDERVLVEAKAKTQWVPAQTVVYATGTRANHSLYDELQQSNIRCHLIGDAVKPRRAVEAVQEAFDLAVTL